MQQFFFSWNWPFINSTASLFCPPEVAHSRAAQIIFSPIHIPTFSWAKMAIAPFWLVCFIVHSLAAFNQNKCINHLSKRIKYCNHSTKWLFSHFFSLLNEFLRQHCVNVVTELHLPVLVVLHFLSFHVRYDALPSLFFPFLPFFLSNDISIDPLILVASFGWPLFLGAA